MKWRNCLRLVGLFGLVLYFLVEMLFLRACRLLLSHVLIKLGIFLVLLLMILSLWRLLYVMIYPSFLSFFKLRPLPVEHPLLLDL